MTQSEEERHFDAGRMQKAKKIRKKALKLIWDYKRVLIFLIIWTLIFIWGHSMMDGKTSAEESRWVMKLVGPILELLVGKGKVTHRLIRKLAHFLEYLLLGMELGARFVRSIKSFVLSLLFGFACACIDEGIQIFVAGRGAQFSDVRLDTAGCLAGILLVLLFLLLGKAFRSVVRRA